MHVRLAVKEAAKARHRHRLGAVLLKGGKPIAVAHNFSYIHAEHAAIGRAWRNSIEGCTIVVVRVRRNGKLGMARPCPNCMERLIDAGIRKIIYSDFDGNMREEKLPRYEANPVNIKFRSTLWKKREA